MDLKPRILETLVETELLLKRLYEQVDMPTAEEIRALLMKVRDLRIRSIELP